MKKEIIVLGDVEMGAGNLTDDFISDNLLARNIAAFAKRKHPVDLVFNGDTFDFLKCPIRLQPSTLYPRHISEKVSLAKLQLIYEAHQKVFKAMRKFVSKKNKTIYFVLGNHDHDLVYPGVQKEIKRLLGNSEQVIFPGLRYQQYGVHIEHGHQYDFLFSINFEKLFLKHKGNSILNFPYVTFGLISAAMHLKEEHPFLERIFPRPALLTHHRVVAKKLNQSTLTYFIKSLIYYPFRYYSDPTYSFPSGMIRELYKRLRTVHWDVDNIMNIIMNTTVHDKLVILGHIHEKRIARNRNQVIIHPGSWRDEYVFQPKTRELVPRRKRYVQVTVEDDGSLKYKLIDSNIRRNIFYFDDVLKQERKYLKMAAQAEGYNLRI